MDAQRFLATVRGQRQFEALGLGALDPRQLKEGFETLLEKASLVGIDLRAMRQP